MTSPYEGIVFDLDGTLIDSAPVVSHILNGMRFERGLPPLELASYRAWSSEGGGALVGNALNISLDEALDLVPEFRKRYNNLPTPMDSVYPGVFGFLSELTKSQIRLAICSNKPENLCNKVLTETGLKDYFDIVIGGDSLTQKKPDPRPLLHTVNLIQVEPTKTLFIGDSAIDKETAKAANIDFGFFTGGYNVGDFLELPDIYFDAYDHLLVDLICKGKNE